MATDPLIAEATHDGGRAQALAVKLGYPAGEPLALIDLAFAAFYVSDLLTQKANLDPRAALFGDASTQLREALQIATRASGWMSERNGLECCAAAVSLATAAEYALMLTAAGPQTGRAAAPGGGGLSARERELVTLVAQGRTDAQIAAQLFTSVYTVRSHLDRVRDKTGCRRRADLTRLALSTGLV